MAGGMSLLKLSVQLSSSTNWTCVESICPEVHARLPCHMCEDCWHLHKRAIGLDQSWLFINITANVSIAQLLNLSGAHSNQSTVQSSLLAAILVDIELDESPRIHFMR